MGTSENEIVDLFTGFQGSFNEEQGTREEIREVVKNIEQIGREIITIMQSIHLESGQNQIPELVTRGRTMLGETKELYAKLKTLVQQGEYYRYNDHWRTATQRLVFMAALITFLDTGELITREAAAETLGIKVFRVDGFHMDLEDYLSGLLLLASELSRFAVNSVTSGDYEKPLQISKFVNELNSGFRLLNFKNDGLRKRYDGLKYDLKKIEEVVYDLSIRGLSGKKSEQQSKGDSP